MARDMQKARYMFVFIATVIIFLLGLFIGMLVNEKKVSIMEEMSLVQNLDDLSLQLQLTYLSSLTGNTTETCKVMNAALEESWVTLASTYSNFVKYKDSPDANPTTVKLFERNTLLNDVRYWFLLKKAKKSCRLDSTVSVLFFFSEEDCYDCGVESTILEYFKKVFGDRFLLFHINRAINEPMVQLLINQYDVDVYPTIIVEDEKFEGLVSKEDLEKIICSKFKIEQPECKL